MRKSSLLDGYRGENPDQGEAPANRQGSQNDPRHSAITAGRAHFFETFVRVLVTRPVAS